MFWVYQIIFQSYVESQNLHLPRAKNNTVDCMIASKQLFFSALSLGRGYCYFYFILFLLPLLFLQVIGSITGVRLIIQTFPGIGLGPRLNVDIHRGALTEGFLAFAIVIISLGLARKIPGSFFMKTWIASVSKLALHILGSDLTGGCMNPASVSTQNY